MANDDATFDLNLFDKNISSQNDYSSTFDNSEATDSGVGFNPSSICLIIIGILFVIAIVGTILWFVIPRQPPTSEVPSEISSETTQQMSSQISPQIPSQSQQTIPNIRQRLQESSSNKQSRRSPRKSSTNRSHRY